MKLCTQYTVLGLLCLASCHVCQILLTAVFVVETWIILPTKNLLKLLCLLLTPGKSYQSCRHCQKCWVETLNAWQVGVTFNKNLGFVQRSFKSILCDIWTSSKLEVSVVTATCGFLWDLHVGKLSTNLVALAQRLLLFWLNINYKSAILKWCFSYCFVFLFPSPMTGVLCGELRRRGVGWNIDL